MEPEGALQTGGCLRGGYDSCMPLQRSTGCTQTIHKGKTRIMGWLSKRREASSKALHDLNGRVSRVEEDLAALTAAHERLRGRFYALKGPASGDHVESKAEILRRFGKI